MKPVLNIVLWALIVFLGYITVMSVYGEIQFNKLKNERYDQVIAKLKDIRDAQLAHRTVTGEFSGNFDDLIKFIDTAEFTITQRKDSTIIDEELTRRFGGVETTRDIVVIDTLGFVPVKDSLFGADSRYRTMMNLPVGEPGAKFELKAGRLAENGIAVFEASVDKAVILFDQDENLVAKEKEVVSVDEVNGPTLKVGSMDEPYTKGNWPKNLSKD
ncbi:MAG: hypothetical protein JJ905_07610 [Psychroserpens sp.]|nr:hypothetical protein [Psychroserpens sp.]MBO6632063.1 hypothetical protein [Psychroserpens sp.]MBO6652998.1 hypothetical protein [Psychroserpens sp.]MBO6680975.1 hypothetical protein [Psychroserpens sp.]MBO6750069.1 hypothetical protein [Psychroserpens sp.]